MSYLYLEWLFRGQIREETLNDSFLNKDKHFYLLMLW
jgi:hypothetical protein